MSLAWRVEFGHDTYATAASELDHVADIVSVVHVRVRFVRPLLAQAREHAASVRKRLVIDDVPMEYVHLVLRHGFLTTETRAQKSRPQIPAYKPLQTDAVRRRGPNMLWLADQRPRDYTQPMQHACPSTFH